MDSNHRYRIRNNPFWLPRSVPQFAFRNKNRLFRAGDRWFESISLSGGRPDLRASTRSTPSALPLVAADPGIYTGRAIHAIRIRLPVEAVQGLSTGRRTRQILSVSSVPPVSSWSRQQAEKRIRVAAGALFENCANNKLACMSVVMLHVKTVALVSSPCLNGPITPQHTVVVLKRALNIEEFDHY
jgi:hypothetical protein